LYYAAWQDHTEAIKLLLEKGANVNAKTNDGVTALIIAAEMGNTEIVKFLLEKGADVNAKRTTDGKTALDAAKRAGHKDIVQLLEKAGDSSARLIEEASSLLRQNRTTEAVERVKSAVAIDPNSHMPWRALFQVSVSLPKEEETLRCWEEMATLYPSNAYCRAMRAAIFHKYGHLSKVKLEFEKAKAAAPRNPFIYAYIVQVYSGMGQYDAAYEAAKTFRDIGGEKEAEETVALFELMLKAILRQFHAVNLPPRTWELPTSYEIDLEMQSIADAWLVQLCAANLKDQKFILGGSTTAVNFAMPKRWKFLGSKDNPVMYAPGFFIWDGAVVAVPQYGVLVVNGTKVKHVEVVGGISRSRIGEVKDWVFTFEKQSKPE
jgi:tetratricopeptide (TPR) repeat protein